MRIKQFLLSLWGVLNNENGYIKVNLGPVYFPQNLSSRPIANAQIYVGNSDTDPEIVGNQIALYVQEEDGTIVEVTQPVRTSAGGVPLYDGSPVTLLVNDNYSLKVLSSTGSQIYYIPRSNTDEVVVSVIPVALASDHTWTGPTQNITAGEELTIGEVAYLKSDGKYWLADADAEATANTKFVMATATIAANGTGIALLPGNSSFIRDDSTTNWTVTAISDLMFLSTVAGKLTNNISGYTTGDIARICGYMETVTVLNFNVNKDFIEVA